MNRKAAKTSVLLSLLFLVVYGTTNWLASLRHNVPGFPFPWERHIPFVPLMILPYMSIDLFFVASPFLSRNDQERQTLARRITAAILIAGCCFILFPLRFAFERPPVDGWLGAIFNNFRSFDRPFNQLPSLHITLGLLLAAHYWRRMKGSLGIAILLWFGLILLSALLTYQHHLIDVIGGLALAVLCFHFIQDEPLRQPANVNTKVGRYYLIGAILLTAGALIARPWTWVLLWPAASLALVAGAYFGVGPGIYRKSRGRLPLTTRLLLAPVLIGHYISLLYYARQCRPWDRLTDRLWIGRKLSNPEARQAIAAGVTAVLDLTAEFSEPRAFRDLSYRQLPILDLTAPTSRQLEEAMNWVRERCEEGVVYVHCKAGYSRTAAVAGPFLIDSGQADSAEGAMMMLRTARPQIIIRPEAAAAIRAYQQSRAGAAHVDAEL